MAQDPSALSSGPVQQHSSADSATAIAECLLYLEDEASRVGLPLLAHLLAVAALEAEQAAMRESVAGHA